MTKSNVTSRMGDAKNFLPSALWRPLRAIGTGLLTPLRFSQRTGHWKSSLQERACTPSGDPLPWYTYAAIDFLRYRKFEDKNVLEFGGGQSTLWWAKHAKSVLTLEADADWYGQLKSKIPANVQLKHIAVDMTTRSKAPMLAEIDAHPVKKFDIIISDGVLRAEAAEIAFDRLAPGGAIILDDSEGYGFYELTSARNCHRIDFYGFAPGGSQRHCTSIAYVDDCFLLDPKAPIVEIEKDDF